jgi:hypothetical protein
MAERRRTKADAGAARRRTDAGGAPAKPLPAYQEGRVDSVGETVREDTAEDSERAGSTDPAAVSKRRTPSRPAQDAFVSSETAARSGGRASRRRRS